ncbi:hypothetical protein BDW22DRAFT_1429762 [Trametopsis cervina]|nr:hypothetical protein BDW22DRAFT_1429762 [Trametopsis cervina]
MRFAAIVAALLVPTATLAAEIFVQAGANGTLTFTPNSVTAQAGDTISVQFMTKNHTFTQSTFASPCTNISDAGLDSGFQFVAANATSIPQFSFNVVNASAPLWFYCRQANHCAQGMVFAVNPSPQKTFDAFKANALASANAPASASGSAGATTVGASSTSGASSTAGASSSASESPSASASPAANAGFKTHATSAVLLSGLGLVAGLIL